MALPKVFRVIRKDGMFGKTAVIVRVFLVIERRKQCYSIVLRYAPVIHVCIRTTMYARPRFPNGRSPCPRRLFGSCMAKGSMRPAALTVPCGVAHMEKEPLVLGTSQSSILRDVFSEKAVVFVLHHAVAFARCLFQGVPIEHRDRSPNIFDQSPLLKMPGGDRNAFAAYA